MTGNTKDAGAVGDFLSRKSPTTPKELAGGL